MCRDFVLVDYCIVIVVVFVALGIRFVNSWLRRFSIIIARGNLFSFFSHFSLCDLRSFNDDAVDINTSTCVCVCVCISVEKVHAVIKKGVVVGELGGVILVERGSGIFSSRLMTLGEVNGVILRNGRGFGTGS